MSEQQGNSQHLSCPECRFRGSYRLSDGRRKCRRCGKKYSPKLRRSHLSPMLLKQLALYFWLTVPAATVATSLQINIKTVRRHYSLMRRAINFEPFCANYMPSNGLQSEEVIGVCFQVTGEGVRIAATCCKWVVGDAHDSSDKSGTCRLNRFYRKLSMPSPLNDFDCYLSFGNESVQNWILACDREFVKIGKLATTLCRMERRRGRQQRLQLLQELAFRFHHRSNPGVTAMLYDFMKPVCPSRIDE